MAPHPSDLDEAELGLVERLLDEPEEDGATPPESESHAADAGVAAPAPPPATASALPPDARGALASVDAPLAAFVGAGAPLPLDPSLAELVAIREQRARGAA
jgi:hypothetical protein